MKEKIITIIDHIGRTVMGGVVSDTDTTITLNNPVIVHVQPNQQTGQLQVQAFPYIFMEFLTAKSRDTNHWTFNKTNIVTSEVELDSKIIEQYHNINTPTAPPQNSDPEVVKLFAD